MIPSCNAPGGQHTGLLYIPATGKYTGDISWGKDSACPMWSDYAHAFTLFATAQMGGEGTWCDNLSPWVSFAGGPVTRGIRQVVCRALPNIPAEQFHGRPAHKHGRAHVRPDLCEPVDIRHPDISEEQGQQRVWLEWHRSQFLLPGAIPAGSTSPCGTPTRSSNGRPAPQALANYYNAMKSGAAAGGQPDYFVMGNDITPAMLGWMRGSMDMASTELEPELEPLGRLQRYWSSAVRPRRSFLQSRQGTGEEPVCQCVALQRWLCRSDARSRR